MIPLRDDNPVAITPYITVGVIVICVLVFLWQAMHTSQGQERIAYALGLVPAVLLSDAKLPQGMQMVPPVATLLTSMFLHGGWLHLIGNMLYLWIFGDNVEAAMGHLRFVIFYLFCGVVAALAQAFAYPHAEVPMIGASGAISGVLGAYLLLHPRARVLVVIPLGLFLPLVYVPAVFLLGVWFLIQLLSSFTGSSDGGGVAFMAHIGGFIVGMLLIPVFRRKNVPLLNRGRDD